MPDPSGLDWLPAFLAEAPRDQDLEALRLWARSGGEAIPEAEAAPAQPQEEGR